MGNETGERDRRGPFRHVVARRVQAALATLGSGRTDTVFVAGDGGATTVARQFTLMARC